MEKIYIGVFKDNQPMGTMMFNSIEEVTVSFVDGLHDAGYELQAFTKEQYDMFEDGDEITADELAEGEYYYEQ
jgi:hypothetical protein